MTQPAKQKVFLKPGAKFSGVTTVGTGKKTRTERTMHVGPCEVEMSEAQIANFSDLLQAPPEVLVSEPPVTESEPEDEEDEDEPDTEPTQDQLG